MSIYLPSVVLENGLFSYEDGVPVFIDHKQTRHYEIGKTMEALFKAGMVYQSSFDAATLRGLDRQITVLHEQLELSQKQISIAYSDAYLSGIAEQKAYDHKLLHAAERENIILHEKVASSNELLKKARRIIEKRLLSRTIPDSSKQEIQPPIACLSPVSFSPHESSFQKSLESAAVPNSKRQDEDCLPWSFSDASSFNLSQQPPIKQIEWICDQLARNSSFEIPKCCVDAVSSCVSELCTNFKAGYPAFFEMIRTFRRLPSKSLSQLFSIPIPKREKGVLSAIQAALNDTGETGSDRQLLAVVKEHLQGKAYKALRRRLDNELALLYSCFDACLDGAQWQLANRILQNAIKEHKQGNDPTIVLQWLQKFSTHPRTLLLTRDRIFQLLDREPALFSQIQNLIQSTAASMKEERPEELRGWYLKFFEIKIPKEQLIFFFGEALAAECAASQLPLRILSPELIAYWIQHKKNEVCAEAFWFSLGSCSIQNDAMLELCIKGVEELYEAECLPKDLKEVPIKDGLVHFLRIWSQRPKSKPIGSLLVSLLRESWDVLSPQEKEGIVRDFARGAEKYPDTLEYRNFLRLLYTETRDNMDLRIVQEPAFLEEVFTSAQFVFSGKEPRVQDEMGWLCLQILDLIDFEQPNFQKMILNAEVQPFLDRIFSKFNGTSIEKHIPDFKFITNCIVNNVLYKSARNFARGKFKTAIAPSRWEAIDNEVFGYSDMANFTPDPKLYNARFMTYAKFVATNCLLEELTMGGLTVERLQELEDAANVFSSQHEEYFENDPTVRKFANFYYLALALAAMRGTPETWSHYIEKNLKSAIKRILETDYLKYNGLTHVLKGCAESDDAYLYTKGVEWVLEKIRPLASESSYEMFLVNVAYALGCKQRYRELSHFINLWKTAISKEILEIIFKLFDEYNAADPDVLKDLDALKHYLSESVIS